MSMPTLHMSHLLQLSKNNLDCDFPPSESLFHSRLQFVKFSCIFSEKRLRFISLSFGEKVVRGSIPTLDTINFL